MRRLIPFAVLLALPGCLAAPAPPAKPAMTRAALAGGAVQVTAPRGYCIDRASLRRLPGGGGFALMAPCARLADPAGPSVRPAVMTVSVMPQRRGAPPPDADSLIAAVAPAPVGQRGTRAGLATAQVMTGGDAMLPGGDPRHWRGARVVGGHLASLALYAPQGSALTGPEGQRLLADLAGGLTSSAKTGNRQTPARLSSVSD